jgi:hypothetical protein
MKTLPAFVIVLALARSVAAQEPPPDLVKPAEPDYSRQKLTQIFSDAPAPPVIEPNVQFHFGAIEFKALNMRWRVAYLPILMPLSGSIPWRNNGAYGALPDPFELTGTEIAYGPRTWKQMRDMNAELKRIERTEKLKAKVVAKPE